MLTALQQEKLKELGYPFDGMCYCGGAMDCICDYLGDEYKSIPVAKALEWFRGVKGIECAVNLYQDDTIEDCIYYVGCYKDCDVIRRIEMRLTHSIAESALLDEVIKYVEIQYSA